MRIDFGKTLSTEEAGPFLTRTASCLHEEDGDFFKKRDYRDYLKYDLKGVEIRTLRGLEQGLQERGLRLTRAAGNGLWVSEPTPFSLGFSVKLPYWWVSCEDDPSKVRLYVSGRKYEQRGTREFKGWLKTKQIPVLLETPQSIIITGRVAYESLENVDPTTVLDALRTQGYESKVITTPEEVVEAFEKIRSEGKSIEGNRIYDYDSNTSKSSPLFTVAGAAVGASEAGLGGAIIGGAVGILFDDD